MVIDDDLGLGSFVAITEADEEIVRQARMLHIKVAQEEKETILAIERANSAWRELSDEDHDRRVYDAVVTDRYPVAAPSLLDVRVVMAAMRADRPS
jgi:hypothetical protein